MRPCPGICSIFSDFRFACCSVRTVRHTIDGEQCLRQPKITWIVLQAGVGRVFNGFASVYAKLAVGRLLSNRNPAAFVSFTWATAVRLAHLAGRCAVLLLLTPAKRNGPRAIGALLDQRFVVLAAGPRMDCCPAVLAVVLKHGSANKLLQKCTHTWQQNDLNLAAVPAGM